MKFSWSSSLSASSAALFLALMAGCSSNPTTEVVSIDLKKRELALDCFASRDGEKMVYGGGQVWQVCRDWAERVTSDSLQQITSVSETAEQTVTAVN